MKNVMLCAGEDDLLVESALRDTCRKLPPGINVTWEVKATALDWKSVTAVVPPGHDLSELDVIRWHKLAPNLDTVSMPCRGENGVSPKARLLCQERGIRIVNAGEYATEATAEHTVGLVIAVSRKYGMGDSGVRNGTWHNSTGHGLGLAGRSVGIVGVGSIGLSTASKLKLLGCGPVVGWSPTGRESRKSDFDAIDGVYRGLEDVFSSDIVCLHTPLTSETARMVDRKLLSTMHHQSILINTARAGLVVAADVVHALRTGAIWGYGVDVFMTEGQAAQDDPILQLDPGKYNVVATPHVGFKTRKSLDSLAERVIRNAVSKPQIGSGDIERSVRVLVLSTAAGDSSNVDKLITDVCEYFGAPRSVVGPPVTKELESLVREGRVERVGGAGFFRRRDNNPRGVGQGGGIGRPDGPGPVNPT